MGDELEGGDGEVRDAGGAGPAKKARRERERFTANAGREAKYQRSGHSRSEKPRCCGTIMALGRVSQQVAPNKLVVGRLGRGRV